MTEPENAIRLIDIISIAAIVLGPIISLEINRILTLRKEKREREFSIFRDLMMTRSSSYRTSIKHVEALNRIDLEFSGKIKRNKK